MVASNQLVVNMKYVEYVAVSILLKRAGIKLEISGICDPQESFLRYQPAAKDFDAKRRLFHVGNNYIQTGVIQIRGIVRPTGKPENAVILVGCLADKGAKQIAHYGSTEECTLHFGEIEYQRWLGAGASTCAHLPHQSELRISENDGSLTVHHLPTDSASCAIFGACQAESGADLHQQDFDSISPGVMELFGLTSILNGQTIKPHRLVRKV